MKSNESRTYSIIQFIVSVIAILFLWLAAFLLAALGFLDGLTSGNSLNQALPVFMIAMICLFCSFLIIPSASASLYRLLGRKTNTISLPATLKRPLVWLLVFPVVLWAGNLVASSGLAWLGLPILHVFAIGLPVLWILSISIRGLPLGSLQRRWGVFASGLVLGPTLILVAEALALIFLLVIVGLWLAGQPALANELGSLTGWLTNPELSQDELLNILAPVLFNPWVLVLALLFAALIVPLIEELFKPIGVWLLWGRKLTPAAGFTAGAISGAGYALFESLALTMGGESWAVVVMARIGTAAVHILTSAITGWALVQAWQKRNYLRLLGAYAFGVLLHGLWNGLAIVSAFASLSLLSDRPAEWLAVLEPAEYAPYLVGFLAVISLGALIGLNLKFNGQASKELARVDSSTSIQPDKPAEL